VAVAARLTKGEKSNFTVLATDERDARSRVRWRAIAWLSACEATLDNLLGANHLQYPN
jgi:hypothetical protein